MPLDIHQLNNLYFDLQNLNNEVMSKIKEFKTEDDDVNNRKDKKKLEKKHQTIIKMMNVTLQLRELL